MVVCWVPRTVLEVRALTSTGWRLGVKGCSDQKERSVPGKECATIVFTIHPHEQPFPGADLTTTCMLPAAEGGISDPSKFPFRVNSEQSVARSRDGVAPPLSGACTPTHCQIQEGRV